MTKGIALDIDNVLSATNLHWARVLAEKFGTPDGLTPEETVAPYILAHHVPHWQIPEAEKWMESARKGGEVQYDLPLIENANHMVNKVNAIIPIKAYVTARSEVVRNRTEAWLWKHDFPRAPVYLRPPGNENDQPNIWKAAFLPTLWPEVIGIVDDDPRLIEYLSDDYQGTVFLYKNTEHKEVSFPVIQCKGWNEVLEEVTKRFGTL